MAENLAAGSWKTLTDSDKYGILMPSSHSAFFGCAISDFKASKMTLGKSIRTNAGGVIIGFLYLTLTYFTVEYLHKSHIRDLESQDIKALSQRLAVLRTKIEAEINSEIFLADSLSTLITFNPASTFAQWEQVAMQLKRKAKHVHNVGVAPNDVISFVYPLEGNEQAMGLDFRDNPQQWPAVERARVTQDIVIAGPLELVQGGIGLIARMPVFSDPPQNQDYWGLCSLVIDVLALLKEAGADDFPSSVSLAMRGVDGKGAEGEVFYGDAAVFNAPLLTETVYLVNGSWQLGLIRKSSGNPVGFSDWIEINLVRIFGYLLALSFLLSFSMIFNAYRIARRASLQDALTRLPNRRYAMTVLEQLFQGGTARGFSIVNIDLNHFKRVNDTHGHGVGDALLTEVARRLKQTLRGSDTVARLGGDEFLLILPRLVGAQKIEQLVAKLYSRVCDEPFIYQGLQLQISLSLGVASFPEHAQNLFELLHHADQAMYQDKQRQKNREKEEPVCEPD
jgi:diguanylate cyclase (GGDEF)-like protein